MKHMKQMKLKCVKHSRQRGGTLFMNRMLFMVKPALC